MITIKKVGHLISHARFSRTMLMAAAVILMMITAAVFVYANGNKQNITISSSAERSDRTDSVSSENQTEQSVFVDAGGCVRKPGVYEVPDGSRVFEVIEKAGGLTEDADTSGINQAEIVTDGMKLTIPSISEKKDNTGSNEADTTDTSSAGNSLININTADSQTLQQIPGIGPVTADKIISYRETNGPFGSIEELTSVSGIGEKTFQKMKDRITC